MAGISRQIGWSQESNLLYYILQQLTKLTSVIFNLKPKYKVFTALLNQSGTGGDKQGITSGEVTQGVTYIIAGDGGDYLNVGAPNNEDGTIFIATNSDVPTSYGDGSLKYDPGSPVATVLENTIGNVWFEYDGQGTYKINTSTSIFDVTKCVVITSPFYSNANAEDQFITSNFNIYGPDAIVIYTKKWTNQILLDDSLDNTPIEIRVYN
jgi:hypothetical protein